MQLKIEEKKKKEEKTPWLRLRCVRKGKRKMLVAMMLVNFQFGGRRRKEGTRFTLLLLAKGGGGGGGGGGGKKSHSTRAGLRVVHSLWEGGERRRGETYRNVPSPWIIGFLRGKREGKGVVALPPPAWATNFVLEEEGGEGKAVGSDLKKRKEGAGEGGAVTSEPPSYCRSIKRK